MRKYATITDRIPYEANKTIRISTSIPRRTVQNVTEWTLQLRKLENPDTKWLTVSSPSPNTNQSTDDIASQATMMKGT